MALLRRNTRTILVRDCALRPVESLTVSLSTNARSRGLQAGERGSLVPSLCKRSIEMLSDASDVGQSFPFYSYKGKLRYTVVQQ